VRLALAMEQHIPGYIDAYSGPPEWKEQAEADGLRPVADLATEASAVAAALAANTGMDPQRHDFLTREVRAMQTSLRILQGEPLTLVEETKALYDIEPQWVDEAVFEDAHSALDELLPPGGSLSERVTARKKAVEVLLERVEPLLHEITAELRRPTRERFALPEDESFVTRFVTNQPWRAYNWYLGDYRSRIEINTDLPLHAPELAELMAHEGYPGHHTEHSIKEAKLQNEKGQMEHSVTLINSPSCVVSEGIATRALSVLMSDEEQIAWHAEAIFPHAGLGHVDARREQMIKAAARKLSGVGGNAAFLLHDQGASEDEVAAYFQRWGLNSAEESRQRVAFLANPLFRSYVFNYRYGGELLDALFASQGERDHWFARLLAEPVTPTQIRNWTAG
jgi:hypothetical protein